MKDAKACTKCFQEKPLEEFPWKNMLRGKRQTICKPCTAARSNQWYKENRVAHAQHVLSRKRADRQEARRYVMQYLSAHPCVECGERDPVVLDFDHIHGKGANVACLIANGATIRRLQQEIDRCQVLCSNCHRRKTARERGWFKNNIPWRVLF